MRFARLFVALSHVLGVASLVVARPARAQDLPRVSVTRKLSVAGIGMERRDQDVLGIARVKFQGLIASELTSIGYLVVGPQDGLRPGEAGPPPLTLVGNVKEEICDSQAPARR